MLQFLWGFGIACLFSIPPSFLSEFVRFYPFLFPFASISLYHLVLYYSVMEPKAAAVKVKIVRILVVFEY